MFDNIIPSVKPLSSAEFREEIPKLIEGANKYIHMSSSLYPEFYNDEKVQAAFENRINKVHMKILLTPGGESNLKKVEYLKTAFINGDIEICKINRDIPHIMVVDGNKARIEKKHPRNKPGVENLIYKNSVKVDNTEVDFIEWWEGCENIEIDEDIENNQN